ncbi:MAG: stage V sporulation protein AC [Bacillota bacterium]|jgi:stage V sporulation protein AC
MTRPGTREREEFNLLAKAYQPPRPILRNIIAAFVVGGLICVVAQIILDYLSARMPPNQAAAMTSSIMVFLGAFLTGLGVYDEIGRHAGMGAALPITGFANSVVSPAMEYKREGFVLGVSARMFQVAGPVIVYGSLSALIVSILRVYVFK